MPPATSSNPSRRSALESALRRLARRDHSEGELRTALHRSRFPTEEIESALSTLRRRGLLDDATFAERFARSRLRRSGQNSVRAELARRRVERTTAEASVRSALGEVSEEETLAGLARRYWARRRSEEASRRIRKLHVFLLRKGFPAELVARKLRELWPEWSEEVEAASLDGEP